MIDALVVARPWALALLPLALLPWLAGMRRTMPWPWLDTAPEDPGSRWLERALRTLASIAIVAMVLALAGPARHHQSIERISQGAHLALVIDRSGSMNSTFAGRTPDGEEESKAAAAKRLLKDFVDRREHDRVGVAAFSTSPMFVLPLTDRREAINAAIDAIDLPGLTHTDIARGLAMAFDLLDERDPIASQAIVLVSDGAAVIDRRVQETLRAAFALRPLRLYWLFLRTERTPGIFDEPQRPGDDIPQIMPERHLHRFFQTLDVPYQAFEAEDAHALEEAIDAIDRAERSLLRYTEAVPQRELSRPVFLVGLLACLALVAAKLAEVRPPVQSSGRGI